MADAVVDQIRKAGGEAIANYDSVSTPQGGESIIQTALNEFGRLDIVVNNAGILRDKSFAKLPAEDLEIVLDVHLRGGFHVSQPAFRVMREQGYGRLVFTASAAGIFGNFGQTNYGAAKMGLVGLSNVIALEGQKYNIRSNVVSPIATTRLTEQLLGPLADALDPELVTPLVLYLCSEECELTHEVLSAGGGRFSRVFIGLTPGWFAGKGVKPTAEEVRDQMDRIRNAEGYTIPASVQDELVSLMKHLQD
jgi:NAD(P)-dependent dehydrogenase (short-subunit alcohol dehydrogenase family)